MLKIGHRGAPGWPRRDGNSISSFERALKAGADGIEFDVRRAKEGAWFLYHGSFPAFRHLGGFSWEKLSRSKRLNTLEECIAWLKGNDLLAVFDIKARSHMAELCEIVHRENIAGRVVFSTFHHGTLEVLTKCLPATQCAMIVGLFWRTLADEGARAAFENLQLLLRPNLIIKRAKKLGVGRLHLKKFLVSEEFLRKAHEAGLQVYVWVVNDRKEIAKFRAMGVDGIISDCPERL